jgi:hypothetical protein
MTTLQVALMLVIHTMAGTTMMMMTMMVLSKVLPFPPIQIYHKLLVCDLLLVSVYIN